MSPGTYSLARVIDQAGALKVLRELHVHNAAGRTTRTVSEEGDFAFEYPPAGNTTNVYSESFPGGFCFAPGTCGGSGTCEGTCINSDSNVNGRPCVNDNQCSGQAGSCDFSFGRCNTYCTANGVECGAGRPCAPDDNVARLASGKTGRCYSKQQVVDYDATSKRVSHTQGCTSCTGGTGDQYYAWNPDGTLANSHDIVTGRYQNYLYDKGRLANITQNNGSADAQTCSVSTTEPCLRQKLEYKISDQPADQALVEYDYRNPAVPDGAFLQRYDHFYYNAAGQKTRVDRVGKVRKLDGTTDPTPKVYTTTFSYPDGRLTTIDPPDTPAQEGQDNTISLTYWPADGTGKSGQIQTITRHVPAGGTSVHQTSFNVYDDFGLPTSITGPDGVTTALSYVDGRLTDATRDGKTTRYDYDGLGRLRRVKLPGNTQCVYYNYEDGGFGQLSTVVVVDSSNCPESATTSQGDHAELTYDRSNRLTDIAFYAAGDPTPTFKQSVAYDTVTGKISRRFDKGNGDPYYKQFLYDAFGRLTNAGDELCSSEICGPDLLSCTCPRSSYVRNGLGQIINITRHMESGSLDNAFQYDAAANLSSLGMPSTASSTATTTYTYDDFGRIAEVSSPDSGVTRYEYDGNDNVIKRRTAAGQPGEQTAEYSYDGANRLIQIHYGGTTAHCSSSFSIGQDVKLHYDAFDGGTNNRCSDMATCQYGTGKLVMAETEYGCYASTPLWYQHWYGYDAQGRIATEKYRWQTTGTTWSDLLTVRYVYDGNGDLINTVLPSGNVVMYTRGGSAPSDARRTTRIQFDVGGLHNPSDVVTNVTYKPLGPVSGYTLAALCPYGSGTPINVSVHRDTAYRISSIQTDCSGLLRREVQPDVPPRAASITDTSPRTCSSTADCLSGDWCAGGVCLGSLHDSYYQYDFASRLKCDQTASAGCQQGAGTTKTLATYTGENISDLTYQSPQWWAPVNETLHFNYVSNSNRFLSATATSGPSRQIAYYYDKAGRLGTDTEDSLSSPHKDAAARGYWRYSDGRISAVSHQTPFQEQQGSTWVKTYRGTWTTSVYDHRGLRILKGIWYPDTGQVEQSFFFYDPEGNLISESRLPLGQMNWEHYDYVNLEGIPVLWHGVGFGSLLDMNLVADHLGRPAAGVQSGSGSWVLFRAAAEAFGWTVQYGWPIHYPLRLPGQYEDPETAVTIFDPVTYGNSSVQSNILMYKPPLHYNGQRFYDPLVGRYLEPDPLGQAADTNVYRYVFHDPVNQIDPEGLMPPGSVPGYQLPKVPSRDEHMNRNANNRCPTKRPETGKPDCQGRTWHTYFMNKYRAGDGSECVYDGDGNLVLEGGSFNFAPFPFSQWHIWEDWYPAELYGTQAAGLTKTYQCLPK